MTASADERGHDARVDAWLARAKAGPHAKSVRPAFETAFDALWARANQTLGDVTLTAIGDRVLYVAAERFPAFSALTLTTIGPTWEAFRRAVADMPEAELNVGLRFVLVEFLSVLGNLTAEVLTPPLHAVLDRLATDASPADETSEHLRASSPAVDGEDTKP